ncbi:hypothetical protein [Peribacillus sp. NPDC096540]
MNRKIGAVIKAVFSLCNYRGKLVKEGISIFRTNEKVLNGMIK